MFRPWCFLITALLICCKSLPDQRPATAQFMQIATESKATRLIASTENNRVTQAIARVESEQSCTGILIGKAVTEDSPAYVLTAGHCLIDSDELTSSNRIFRDALPRSDRNLVHFAAGDFQIGRVVYATMKGVDLAIAELTEEVNSAALMRLTERRDLDADEARLPQAVTMQRMKQLGIEPLNWAPKMPAFGDGIRIVSAAPGEEAGSQFLREHRCRHEGLTDVVEYIWHWYDVARNNCEDILPGSSGSPVLDTHSAVFAIVNTSSRNALSQDCYLGQPCELTEESFQVAAARNYGSRVLDLPGCFNAQGFFQVEQPGCPLESTSHWQLKSQVKTPINPQFYPVDKRRWNVLHQQVHASTGFRFKTGRLPKFDCRHKAQYSERLGWSDLRLRDLPLPTEAGLYALCLISEEEFRRQDLRYPAMLVLNIDQRPPQLQARPVSDPVTQEPLVSVRKVCPSLPMGATLDQRKHCAVGIVSFELRPYEIADFYHGWVSIQDQDCQRIKNEGRGLQAHISVAALPAKVCVWAIDGAGNRSQEPALIKVRAATRREIIEATDVMVDWSLLQP